MQRSPLLPTVGNVGWHGEPGWRVYSNSSAAKPILRAFLLLATLASCLWATNLRQMDLESLVLNSEQICRVTVLSVTKGSVEVGGGTIPTLTYKLEIMGSFKGRQQRTTTVTMVTMPKEESPDSGIRRFPLFEDVPRLKVGNDYVLFLTRPSSAGLSTTVGLGQGCFEVLVQNDKEVAVNSFNNAGLGFEGSSGPVPYERLVNAIEAEGMK